MTVTPLWKLHDVAEGSASAEVDYNHNLRWLEAIGNAVALEQLGTPPGSPSEGDVYLISSTPGSWPGEDHEQQRNAEHGDVALFANGSWEFRKAPVGYAVWDESVQAIRRWNGSNWA